MTLVLDDLRRQQLIARLQTFFQEEFEESLSAFRAEQTLDFFLATLGPPIYNQAVQDARKFVQERLDDLDGEVYLPEGA
jgi:uncharacterized protein (DUF2164 family)